jgi:serine protease Do
MKSTLPAVVLAVSATAALSLVISAPRAQPVTASAAKTTVAASLSDVIPDVAERTVKSVVSIKATQKISPVNYDGFDNDPFDRPDMPEMRGAQSAGSGVIINNTGRIVTNAHVVRNATDLSVELSDGTELPATLIGFDERTDIAVLQLKSNAPKIAPLAIGSSDSLRLGEVVLAIGNPFGVGHSVSMGIISAKSRHIGLEGDEDFLQTDAAINPGNSGGALVNLRGELVGINTAIASQTNAGVGFAIPTSMMMPVVEMIAKDGKVSRAYLGVEMQGLTPQSAKQLNLDTTRGILIKGIFPGSPAAGIDLKPGDVIVSLNGQPIKNDSMFKTTIGLSKVGTPVSLEVLKGGKGTPRVITAKLGLLPETPDRKVMQKRQLRRAPTIVIPAP